MSKGNNFERAFGDAFIAHLRALPAVRDGYDVALARSRATVATKALVRNPYDANEADRVRVTRLVCEHLNLPLPARIGWGPGEPAYLTPGCGATGMGDDE